MKITLGFSPCPNDTFIFDALVNGKIDTAGFEFEAVLEDVQTLNQWAIENKLHVTKLSYGVLPLVLTWYKVLNSGSALGKGVGPLLIGAGPVNENEINNYQVALPGNNTTAHLLFSMAYPDSKHKVFMRYDGIEDFVLNKKGLGVIIHENRFTYAEKGLTCIADLGEYWENKTGNPIPLGGIVVQRKLDNIIQQKIDLLIRNSIEYAFAQYPILNDYTREHSQEMSEAVMRKHIQLYVNNYSLGLGTMGKAAIEQLLRVYEQLHGTQASVPELFVPENR